MDVWCDLLLRELCDLGDPAQELLNGAETDEASLPDADIKEIEHLLRASPEAAPASRARAWEPPSD
ncbi:MAG: hypothetical protein ACE5JD_08905 [Candidatus Methylomirabilia bacterium]